jgi:hypothetical protein
MTTTVVKRQIIRDADDNPIAVILPMEKFALVKDTLDQQSRTITAAANLDQMRLAAQDPLFLADLRETMLAFTPSNEQLL